MTRGETPLPLMRARLYRSSFDLNDLGVTSMPRFLQHYLHNELVSDRTCEHAVPLAVDQITVTMGSTRKASVPGPPAVAAMRAALHTLFNDLAWWFQPPPRDRAGIPMS